MARTLGIAFPLIDTAEYDVGDWLPATGRQIPLEVTNQFGAANLNLTLPFPRVAVGAAVNCLPTIDGPFVNPTIVPGMENVGGSSQGIIGFSVLAPGPFSFDITIPTDDPNQPLWTITVVGNGAGSIPTPTPPVPPANPGSPYLQVYEVFGRAGIGPYTINLGRHHPTGVPIGPIRMRYENIGDFPGVGGPLTIGPGGADQPTLDSVTNANEIFTQVPAGTVLLVQGGGVGPSYAEWDLTIEPIVKQEFEVKFKDETDDTTQANVGVSFGGTGNGSPPPPPPPDVDEYKAYCAIQLARIRTSVRAIKGLSATDISAPNVALGGFSQQYGILTGLLEAILELEADYTLLEGLGSPDGNVHGHFGQRYLDLGTSTFFVCRSTPSGKHWDDIGGGGGAPPATLGDTVPLLDPIMVAELRNSLLNVIPIGKGDVKEGSTDGGGTKQLYEVEGVMAEALIAFNRLSAVEGDGDPNGGGEYLGKFGQMYRDRLTGDWYICRSEPSGPDWSGPF